jgi:hypothetical protein
VVPTTVTQEVVRGETAAVTSWAARRGWTVQVDVDALTLTAVTTHPACGVTLTFRAALDGYPALPPAWTCHNAAGESPRSAYPAAGSRPGVSSSIFHANPVICAPWNRLAYAEHSGPHGDWGGQTNWKDVDTNFTRAQTLADMLAALHLHLSASPGMQA